MSEGTKTYNGWGVPLFGESEIIQQTAATDIITLTGSTGTMSGDFFVCQNSSGAELAVLDCYGGLALSIQSTVQAFGLKVNVTSTGAATATSVLSNAFLVTMSSKANLNAVIGYDSALSNEVGACNYFLAVYGSKAPTYFIGVGTTVVGAGNVGSNGFAVQGKRFLSAPSTTDTPILLKIQVGDSTYYVPSFNSGAFN